MLKQTSTNSRSTQAQCRHYSRITTGKSTARVHHKGLSCITVKKLRMYTCMEEDYTLSQLTSGPVRTEVPLTKIFSLFYNYDLKLEEIQWPKSVKLLWDGMLNVMVTD